MTNILRRYFVKNTAPVIKVYKWTHGKLFLRKPVDRFEFVVGKLLIQIRKPYPKDWIETASTWISPDQNFAFRFEDWQGEEP